MQPADRLISAHSIFQWANGPVFIESQADIVVDFIKRLERQNIKSIEAQPHAEQIWKSRNSGGQ